MFKEFREFAMKGSVLDMAVGITIGAAFGAVDERVPLLLYDDLHQGSPLPELHFGTQKRVKRGRIG